VRLPKRLPRSLGFKRYALLFDGIDDYVLIGDILDGLSQLTIEAVVWVAGGATLEWKHIEQKRYCHSFGVYWDGANQKVFLGLGDGSSWIPALIGNIALKEEKWYHIVGIIEGSLGSIYVNGEPDVLDHDFGGTMGSNTEPLVIGSNSPRSNWWWNGLIAFVRIYDRPLTPEEIRYNMLNYHSPIRDGLVLWLHDKIVGDTWHDESGYCITEDSRAFFDTGYIEVSKARDSERILTINGFSPILNRYRRWYEGKIVRIKSRGFEVGLTPEHKVLVVPRAVAKRYRLTQNMRRWRGKPTYPPNFQPIWKPASEVEVGDYLVVPKVNYPEEDVRIEPFPEEWISKKVFIYEDYLKGLTPSEVARKRGCKLETVVRYYHWWRKGENLPKRYVSTHGKVPLDEQWASIFGWYVAEGYARPEHGKGRSGKVVFTLGPDEEIEAKELAELLRKKGLNPHIIRRQTTIIIEVNSNPFAHFLIDNFGVGALNKRIPEWMFRAKRNIVKAFLIALNKGDGWVAKRKGKRYYSLVSFQTSSPKLVEGITLLLMKLGIFPHVAPMNRRGYFINPQGKLCKQNPAWDIRVEGHDVLKLYEDLPTAKRKVRRYLENDRFFFIPVSSVKVEDYSGWVYDFETESHTLGMPFIIHNSNDGTIYGAVRKGLAMWEIRSELGL